MKGHKVGQDSLSIRLKRNFHTYRMHIASSSAKMFWASVVITLSFILSQAYLILFH